MQHAYPIICLSASTCPTDATASKDRFYVQGAADDEESWSLGLNATLFWKHHSDLLSSSEEELHDLILSLVAQDVPSKDSPSSGFRVPNTNLRLLLNPVSHLQSGVLFTREEPASPSDFKLSSFKKGKDSIQKCMNHLIETLKTIKTCQHDAPTEIGYHESVSASEGSDWVAAAAVILLCRQ